ncbi:MAG: response regulator [Blautia sp.]|nr:response regulator [Blautia sp.]
MRILIVDDEKLTREGLSEGICWSDLGIDDVRLADDGQSGLECAHKYPPQIVLTDVRMPRMDGIRMAERLQSDNPDIRVIFMSGYSDREYLKAAIRLKAISYVEKPIMLSEVESVVREAVTSAIELKKIDAYNHFSEIQLRKHIAEQLILPGTGRMLPDDLELLKQVEEKPCFSMILQFQQGTAVNPTESILATLFRPVMESFHAEEFHTLHHNSLYICHVFSQYVMNEDRLAFLASLLCDKLRHDENTRDLVFHLVTGPYVDSWKNLYTSYSTAVISLQKMFYREPGSCFINSEKEGEAESRRQVFANISFDGIVEAYRRLLVDTDREGMEQFLADLLARLTEEQNILPGQIKDLYYLLFTSLRTAEQTRGISQTGGGSTMELASGSISVYSLHRELCRQTENYLQTVGTLAQAPSTVDIIRRFIETHYSDPALSIKMISDHVHLSTSYICTLYKNETGNTLNQFITDYRMQKARELLMDVRNKVQDISGAVGFTDSGYFSKAFKKCYGVSPSEFRGGVEKSI